MKVSIVYIFPNAGEGGYFDLAVRFLDSYAKFPPGMDHDSIVVCNGSPATDETRFYFGSLPNLTCLDHDGSGYDIGGFQKASREIPSDLMVFFGSTAYLRQSNWLVRMVDAYQRHGDTIYGAMGNQGVGDIYPHIRTTGFWMSPALLNRYPIQVTRPEQRYEFEHGRSGLTTWLIQQGKQPWVSAVNGDWVLQACNGIPGGYHNGSQENLLTGDRLTRPPYHPCE